MREAFAATMFTTAAGLIARGAFLIAESAGYIVAGVAVGVLTWFFFAELG